MRNGGLLQSISHRYFGVGRRKVCTDSRPWPGLGPCGVQSSLGWMVAQGWRTQSEAGRHHGRHGQRSRPGISALHDAVAPALRVEKCFIIPPKATDGKQVGFVLGGLSQAGLT